MCFGSDFLWSRMLVPGIVMEVQQLFDWYTTSMGFVAAIMMIPVQIDMFYLKMLGQKPYTDGFIIMFPPKLWIFEVCSIFEHTHLVLENTRGIERIALENPQQEHSVAAHARRGEIQSVWLKLGYHSPTKREWWQPLRIRNVYQKMSKFETYWDLQSWVMFWGSKTRILQVSWQLFTMFYQSCSILFGIWWINPVWHLVN